MGEPGHGVGSSTLAAAAVEQWRAWWATLASCDDTVLRAAASQGFVLHVNELAGLGVSRQRARTAVRRGRWEAPCRGVVAPLSVATDDEYLLVRRRHALASAAEALVHRDTVVNRLSAANLHGLPTFTRPVRPILTAGFAGDLGRRGGAHVRGAELFAEDVGFWFGARVTTPARTVIDIARLSRRDGIVVADAALRAGTVSPAELSTALDVHRGWPGVRQARDIVSLADARAESPLESITRLALHDDGFPAPTPQVAIAGHRVDLLWPERRLVLECDGRIKYGEDEGWWAEKRREQALRHLDYQVERVTWADVVVNWPFTSARLRRLLRLHA